MSAPNAGRQSPEPETQSDKQINAVGNPNQHGVDPKATGGDASKEQLKGLESNPKGPLDDAAAAKTAK